MLKLTSPSQVRTLLRDKAIQPHGALGQNFLIDANIRDLIVDLVDPGSSDVILEIGPGLGVLTEPLAARAGTLIAVEKDRKLFQHLQEQLVSCPNVRLVQADFLTLDLSFLAADGVSKVVSNLPYSVGSRMLMDLFALPEPPRQITVTVQLEVGERLTAGAGDPQRGLLGVWAQRVYVPQVRKVISPSCFLPPPKIRSAVVQLDRLPGPGIDANAAAFFRRVTKSVFGYRRKQLGTILRRTAPELGLDPAAAEAAALAAGLDASLRPEMLSVQQWQDLADAMRRQGGAARP